MTPDIPKGPEDEVPPRSLREHVAAAIAARDGRHLGLEPLADATYEEMADAALEFVGAEMERITFDRDAAQAAADLLVQQLEDLRDDVLGDESLLVPEIVSAAARTVERLTSEVERLRTSRDVNSNDAGTFASLYRTEQARANELEVLLDKTEDAYSELLRGMADRASKLRRQADRWHRRAEQEFRDRVTDTAKAMAESGQQRTEVSRLREQLAAARTELHTVENEQMDVVHALGYSGQEEFEWDAIVDSVRNGVSARQQLAIAYDEARSLREQLAAQPPLPQDAEAKIRLAISDPGSQLPRYSNDDGARETVSRWSGRAVMQLLKTWGVSSSEVEAPQPPEMAQHRVVVVEAGLTAYVAGCTTCRTSVAGSKKVAEDWKDQHEADTLRPTSVVTSPKGDSNDGGRPSGSERLAPRPHEAAVENALADALTDQYGFLPLGVRYGAAKAAREIVEQWLDSFTGDEVAAQAARSAATPEDPQPRVWPARSTAPEDSVRMVIAENDVKFKRTPWGDWEAVPPEGDGRGYSWARINEFMTLTEVPSPSLPKEGEDSD